MTAKHVLVVGAGGNIGSHLVPHLGRIPEIGRVTLIDRDTYDASNLATQNITRADLAGRKASVQARRLRRINPSLDVRAITRAVEDLPLGTLRGDLVLAGLDSRRARQWVNQACWRLGVPWIDAGVEASGLLARVNVYVPGDLNPCLECAWDERDYAALEQAYPCTGAAVEPPPTGAPSSLGALAASLQAIECRKILRGQWNCVLAGRQLVLDATHHKQYVTAFRRNPLCRLTDHGAWTIEPLDRPSGATSLKEVFDLAEGGKTIRVVGRLFVKRLTCTGCGRKRTRLRASSGHPLWGHPCSHCDRPMVPSGLDVDEALDASTSSLRTQLRSLASLGIQKGDVLTLGYGPSATHYEIRGDAR